MAEQNELPDVLIEGGLLPQESEGFKWVITPDRYPKDKKNTVWNIETYKDDKLISSTVFK